MDALLEIVKALVTFGVIVAITLLIPILFIFILTIATSLDDKMDR